MMKPPYRAEYSSIWSRIRIGWRSLKLYYAGKETEARLLLLRMYEDEPEEAATQ